MKLSTPRVLAAITSAAVLLIVGFTARSRSAVNSATPSILQPKAPRPRVARTPGKSLHHHSARASKVHGYVQKALPAWVASHNRGIGGVHLKPHTRVVALTFDDGPWPVYTDQILKILKHEQVHATFFMIGRNVSHWPALARRVVADGHAVGNHTWNHPAHPHGARSEITRTDALLKQILGFTPNLFRPPYGMLRNGLAANARQQGKAVVLWSADSTDWNHASTSTIYTLVMRQCRPGGIVLMHDGGGDRAPTVAALPDIIAALRARGYRFVTVPELLAMRVAPPQDRKPSKKFNQQQPIATKRKKTLPTATAVKRKMPVPSAMPVPPATSHATKRKKPVPPIKPLVTVPARTPTPVIRGEHGLNRKSVSNRTPVPPRVPVKNLRRVRRYSPTVLPRTVQPSTMLPPATHR